RDRLRQRRDDRRGDPAPLWRHEGDRQRPSGGGPRRARRVLRVEIDLRRLLGEAPARADGYIRALEDRALVARPTSPRREALTGRPFHGRRRWTHDTRRR